jgi:NAD-dependent DNA ligase
MAAQLKGVGWERAKAVDGKFGSVVEMVCAPQGTWKGIDGIGDKLSRSIVAEMEGRQG